jgi:hypothetical protein
VASLEPAAPWHLAATTPKTKKTETGTPHPETWSGTITLLPQFTSKARKERKKWGLFSNRVRIGNKIKERKRI